MFLVDSLGRVSLNGTITVSPGWSNSHIAAGAAIAADKLEHEHFLNYYQAPGTAIVAATVDLCVIGGATGLVVSISAAITGAIATGGDRTVTVDLHRSTAGGAFATVLTTPPVLDNTSVLRTPEAGVVSASLDDLVATDILRLIVTVAGAAGNQGQGLIVTVGLTQTPVS